MIYLDNAATTRVIPDVVNELFKFYQDQFINPSSLYAPNSITSELNNAREALAKKLSCSSKEIYFTSGATEANNWAIFNGFRNRKGNVVTSCGEHASVYECFKVLKNRGVEVRFVPLNSDGTLNEEKFEQLVDKNTLFVSIIHCSNETGCINDVFRLCRKAKAINPDIIFHSDGVQMFCKTSYPKFVGGLDLYSISGHKVGAPKGIGALYIRDGLFIQPYIYGGGQEQGLRSGTENTSAIVGFAKASEIYFNKYDKNKIFNLNKQVVSGLLKIGNVRINTLNEYSNIVSASILGVKAEILQRILAKEKVYIGIGSACASRHRENRVLKEMGLDEAHQAGNIRISFDIYTKSSDIVLALKKIEFAVNLCRGGCIG